MHREHSLKARYESKVEALSKTSLISKPVVQEKRTITSNSWFLTRDIVFNIQAMVAACATYIHLIIQCLLKSRDFIHGNFAIQSLLEHTKL